MSTLIERRARFRDLHRDGLFVMPNAWDVGSARLLAWLGFPAVATTSSGHAASLGRTDQSVTRDELIGHVEALAAAVEVPLSVDAERCFPEEPGGVVETVRLLAEAGAAGFSIEDYDPRGSEIEPLDGAVGRVAAVAAAATGHGLVLTARAENHLYGIDDLDDTIARLRAYRAAGADVVYAPGVIEDEAVGRLVAAVDAPVNVLALRGAPTGRPARRPRRSPRLDRGRADARRLWGARDRRARAAVGRDVHLPGSRGWRRAGRGDAPWIAREPSPTHRRPE